jgi:FkbM family methyltransferase
VGWWARLKYRRLLARMAAPRLLAAFADAFPQALFVEIGANDGEQHDHLRPIVIEHRWRGILVEPVPYVFARLAANYEGVGHVILENAAIADRDGELPFFHLREADRAQERLPRWYDGIGSFSREAVLSHRAQIPDIDERLVETRVPALTFDSLLAKHAFERVDLVLIDTEGYDWEVLRTIDLDRQRPALIVYEHFHLDPAVRGEAREHVAAHRYETMEEGFDTFCLDPGADAALTARWRALEPAVAGVSKHDERAAA